MREKEERSKQGQTNNKAKQHSTPKAVTFPKKNELPWVGLEPTTLYTLDRALYHMYIFPTQCGEVKEVRLVRNRDGRPKGFAYVEYAQEVIHVLMRDEKEGRKKQARSNKQQGKATQHTQGSPCIKSVTAIIPTHFQ